MEEIDVRFVNKSNGAEIVNETFENLKEAERRIENILWEHKMGEDVELKVKVDGEPVSWGYVVNIYPHTEEEENGGRKY